jgi:hypothetical protein
MGRSLTDKTAKPEFSRRTIRLNKPVIFWCVPRLPPASGCLLGSCPSVTTRTLTQSGRFSGDHKWPVLGDRRGSRISSVTKYHSRLTTNPDDKSSVGYAFIFGANDEPFNIGGSCLSVNRCMRSEILSQRNEKHLAIKELPGATDRQNDLFTHVLRPQSKRFEVAICRPR